MGKDNTKNLLSNNATRLYSPWHQNDSEAWLKKSHKFGLISKEDDFETCIDENMKRTILRIEQEQLERIEHLREEDSVEEGLISKQAQRLGIHSSSKTCQPFKIPSSDYGLTQALNVPQEQQKQLVTLEQAIPAKELSRNDQSLSAANSQVALIYKKIGFLLARFQSASNRLPKAMKIIPSLPNWDHILLLTNPSSWTPQATCEITRLFLSNVKATQTKRFLQFVLLHAVRNNLANSAHGQQLDPALYIALRKALICSPALFMKGLIFPLCESNSCTVAEACVLASLLAQTKIPALQSATALLRLSEQLFTLPICIFVQVLLEKRQTMPYRVVDILTFRYFCQREEAVSQLPLVWYHSLHIFVQNYSSDMVPTQKTALLALIKRVSRNDELSFAIEKSIKSAIKSSDEDLAETDDSDDTVIYSEDTDSSNSTDGMLIDDQY